MNLNTITEVRRPNSTDEIPEWREGYAWLAGGTWLFSTPQISTHTLIDLESLRWPALKLTPDSPIAWVEFGNAQLLLHGAKGEDDAAAAFAKATKLKPRDAMERLDAEWAKAQLA